MIEVSNLKKNFGSTQALCGVDFEIRPQEVVGFLGPNGAGKTTTMRILTGYFTPDGGSAKVAGLDVAENSLAVRKKIGYLPENNPLWDDLEVAESIRFHGELRGLPKRLLKSRILETIDLCGLHEAAGKKIGELSKGYRQRVGLAQALVADPEILILDEPTSGLDPHQIIEIRNLILEIGKQKTVLLSSHILPEVEATCGRILILHEGRIAGSGTPAELASRAQGQGAYRARIRGRRGEILSGLMESLPLSEIHIDSEGDGYQTVLITSRESGEFGEKIFQAVVRNGWTLSELSKEKTSLEDVFLRLTGTNS